MGKNSGNGKMATNGRGRPSVLTPEVQKTICEAIEDGCYVETAVSLAGISRPTFYVWLKKGAGGDPKYSDFVDTIKKAMAKSEHDAIQIINKAAEKNWTAAAWKLERRYPHKYGLRNREAIPADEIPEERGAVFDPSLLTVPELKKLIELVDQMEELHKKGLPADVLEAEFTAISDKATSNGKGEAG